MKRGARQTLILALVLSGGRAGAQDGDMFIGGQVDGGGRSSTSLSAPWRGGRHSGPIPDSHLVHRGDTLWDISGYYYGNPWDWPRIWSINPEIENPHWIYPDNRVRLRGEGGDGTVAASSPSVRVSGRPAPSSGTVRVRNTGYLDEDALENAGEISGSPVDHMMLTTGDEIFVRYEEDGQIPARGTELTVYRRIPAAERDRDESGTLVRILGTAVVRSYDERHETVRAEIVEAFEPIERGFRVAEVPRRIENVAPVTNDRDIDTTVAATLYPRNIIGDQQLIFVEVGSEEGVRVGNRFFVVREVDPWYSSLASGHSHAVPADGRTTPASGTEYPPEVLAEARVVSLRPHSATLMVTRALQEIAVGDRAEMRQGF